MRCITEVIILDIFMDRIAQKSEIEQEFVCVFFASPPFGFPPNSTLNFHDNLNFHQEKVHFLTRPSKTPESNPIKTFSKHKKKGTTI